MKPTREPASSRPKPCVSLKKSRESCPFAAPCGTLVENDRGQTPAFPFIGGVVPRTLLVVVVVFTLK